jgi:hypothetical protein
MQYLAAFTFRKEQTMANKEQGKGKDKDKKKKKKKEVVVAK